MHISRRGVARAPVFNLDKEILELESDGTIVSCFLYIHICLVTLVIRKKRPVYIESILSASQR